MFDRVEVFFRCGQWPLCKPVALASTVTHILGDSPPAHLDLRQFAGIYATTFVDVWRKSF
jgi:hypothetical protein